MLSTIITEEKLDPRIKRTRQVIVQSFDELIKEKGFQSLSVQDITTRAGINRATFYAHFPDKYDLLEQAIQQNFRHEIEKRMLNACQFSMINLKNLIMAVCEFLNDTHGPCPLGEHQFQSLVEGQVRSQIYGLINHWLENIPLSKVNPQTRESAATAASWALYGLANEWNLSKQRQPLDEYSEQVLPLLTSSLGMSVQLG